MIQIKIFTNSSADKVQTDANTWLQENDGEHHITSIDFSMGGREDIIRYGVMVTYEERSSGKALIS